MTFWSYDFKTAFDNDKNMTIGSLSKSRRRLQREWHKTKGLMSKTIAVHMHYKSLYICMPSSAEQQHEMTKFCIVYGTIGPRRLIFRILFGFERPLCIFGLNTFLEPLAYPADLNNREFRLWNINSFFTKRHPRCHRRRRCLSSLMTGYVLVFVFHFNCFF